MCQPQISSVLRLMDFPNQAAYLWTKINVYLVITYSATHGMVLLPEADARIWMAKDLTCIVFAKGAEITDGLGTVFRVPIG